VWFADLGVLFFSDFDRGDVAGNFNGSIMRYTPGVGCEPFIEDVGTNGLAIAPDGQLIAVSHKTQEVIEFDLTTKAPTSLGSLYMAKHFGSPNDIASHTSGAIFFTDPAAEKGNRPQELPTALYRIDPLGVLDLVEEFDRANGVNFSPDQTKMYLSNYDFEVRVYDVSPEGVASNGTHFLDVGSDGMGVDCAGNIYTTAGDVRVWSPQGQMIGSMGGLGTVTNIAFGGPNGTTMFITSFDGDLKSVETNIPGLPY
jgi:gluconolactonase